MSKWRRGRVSSGVCGGGWMVQRSSTVDMVVVGWQWELRGLYIIRFRLVKLKFAILIWQYSIKKVVILESEWVGEY